MINRFILRALVTTLALACATTPPPPPKVSAWDLPAEAPARKTAGKTGDPKQAGKPAPKSLHLDEFVDAHRGKPANVWRERSVRDYERIGETIIGGLATLRQLRPKEVLAFRMLDHAKFQSALDRTRTGFDLDGHKLEFDAEVFAFGLQVPPADMTSAPSESEKDRQKQGGTGTVDDWVAGFYDPKTKGLYVRRRAFAAADEIDHDSYARSTLAHEMQHALQDQHYGLADFSKFDDDDRLMAYRALVEGDAFLTEQVFEGALYGWREKSMVKWTSTIVRLKTKLLSRVEKVGFRSKYAEAPTWFVDTMMFPYEQGAVFLSRVFLTQGFSLFPEIFEHPPQSTEHILHPDSYMRGDAPVAVPSPVAPAGWRVVASGNMGEFGLRTALDECLDRRDAEKAAAGWGGDSYAIFGGDGGATSLALNTTWDDEAEAKEFEAAARDLSHCWTADRQQPRGWRIGADLSVKRSGTRVAVLRGMTPAMVPGQLQALLAARVTKPPSKVPLPGYTLARDPYEGIEDRFTPDDLLASKMTGRTWEHPYLGIRAELPAGLDIRADTISGGLTVITQTPKPGLGTLFFLRGGDLNDTDRPVDGEPGAWDNLVFGSTDRDLRTALRKKKLVRDPVKDRKLPIGEAKVHAWRVTGSRERIEAIVVPACAGGAAWYFLRTWESDDARRVLETWLESFKSTGKAEGDGGICEDL